jgi:hypothetical protein
MRSRLLEGGDRHAHSATHPLAVSGIGIGRIRSIGIMANSPDRNRANNVIHGPYDVGLTTFDSAEAYDPRSKEDMLGSAMAVLFDNGTPVPTTEMISIHATYGVWWTGHAGRCAAPAAAEMGDNG